MTPLDLASWAQSAVGGSMLVALPVALLAGVVSFLSPCVVPLLPGYLSYATGMSATQINNGATDRRRMLLGTSLFVLATLAMLPFVWVTPGAADLCMLAGLGLAGGLGQYFLYEGFRFAPASAVAPVEYTGLVWAFLYGYLVWADVPTLQVVAGALVIVASSLVLIWREHADSRRSLAIAGD